MLSEFYYNNLIYCPDMSKSENRQRLKQSAHPLMDSMVACLIAAACFNALILLLR